MNKLNLAHKTRIYPSKEQIKVIENSFGVSRFTFNKGLDIWKQMYEKYKETNNKDDSPSWSKIRNLIVSLKRDKEFSWLNDVPSGVIKTSCSIGIKNAFKNFFNKKSKSRYPRYKSKHKSKKSFTIERETNYTFKYDKDEKLLKIPTIGNIKLAESLRWEFNDNIKQVTISNVNNKYYISIIFELEQFIDNKINHQVDVIGCDLGIKSFLVTNLVDENNKSIVYNYSTKTKRVNNHLKKLHKNLSRKKKVSNNRTKARTKLLTCYEKLSNMKKDFLHKTTTELTRLGEQIVIEDLKVKNMIKNRKLSNSLHNSSFYEFRRMISYKSILRNINLIIADSFFPSSKTCNNCGAIKDSLSLSERIFKCECGYEEDRDVNAALNLAII